MNNLDDILPRIAAADPDRLRASKLAEPMAQTALGWIYAFHLELAKVPELVSEPMIGEIRYQWWREAVAEIYEGGHVRAHEVTTPLSIVLREYDVPRFWVDRLIDGRNRDLDPSPFVNITEAIDYCHQTSGVLMQIAARCLTADFDEQAVLAAGEAWGLTGLARAYRYYHDRMLSNLSFDEIVSAAGQAYDKAHAVKLSSEILPSCAYVGLVPKYLDKMSAQGFHPKTDSVIISPFSKQANQFKTVLTGRL